MKLIDFAKLARPEYEFDWFHELLFELLEKCAQGDPEVPNLLISMPPGMGKTENVMIIFSAWLVAHNPLREHVIAVSNADTLARLAVMNAMRVLKRIEVADAFPVEFLKETENQVVVEGSDGRPALYGTSIMGQVTGMRGTWVLADDLVKNLEVAYSQDQLEKIWQNLMAVCETRLLPQGKIVNIATRWSLADPSGRFLDRATKNPKARQFVFLNLAAWNTGEDSYILETKTGKQTFLPKYKAMAKVKGQAYSFSRADLEQKRADVGPNLWSALYMGNPVNTDSQLFPPDCWGMYDGINEDELELVVSSWDFASKTGSRNDFSANVTLARTHDGRILVLDVFKTKMEFSQLPGMVLARWQSTAQRYRCVPGLVCEDSSAGTQVIQLFQASQPLIPLAPIKPTRSKVIRAEGITPLTRGGVVFLPRNAPWLESFISELANFPVGVHDDVVDAFVNGMKSFVSGGDFRATRFLLPPQMSSIEAIKREALQEMLEDSPTFEIMQEFNGSDY